MTETLTDSCAAEGCSDERQGRLDYCTFHYQRVWRGTPVDAPRRARKRRKDDILARNEAGEKHCTHCDTWKPEGEFPVQPGSSDGLGFACKPCKYLLRVLVKYNVDKAWYDGQKMRYDGKCQVCDRVPSQWHVDHDHDCCPGDRSCGVCVRGLICQGCNKALGYMRDNPTALRRAAEYLERFNG